MLRTALALADAGGIESLTMRKLGQELGVEAMSLYNHVENKDDIVDGIIELVLDEIEVPSGEGDWKTEIRRTAISSHEVFLRHRWACSLMMHRPNAGAGADALDGGGPANAAGSRLLGRHDPPRVSRPRQPHHGLHALAGEHAVRDQGGARRHGRATSCSRSPPTSTPT